VKVKTLLLGMALFAFTKAVAGGVISSLYGGVVERLRAPFDSAAVQREVHAALYRLTQITPWVEIGLAIVFFALALAYVLRGAAGRRGRIMWTGVVLYGLWILIWSAQTISGSFTSPDALTEPSAVKTVLSFLQQVFYLTGASLVVWVLAAPLPRPAARALPITFGVLIILSLLHAMLRLGGVEDQTPYANLALMRTIGFYGASGVLAIVCLWRAFTEVDGPAGDPQAMGRPLRILVTAALIRLGIGLLALGLIAYGLSRGDNMGPILVLGTTMSAFCAVGIVTATVLLLRQWPPEALERTRLHHMIFLVVLALIIELAITPSTLSLYEVSNRIRNGGSDWGLPSFRELEELQTLVVWGGRATHVCGLVAMAALLRSLGATARYLDDVDALAETERLFKLLAIAGTLAIVAGFFVGHRRIPVGVVAAMGLGGLVVGFLFLVGWVRTCLTLARGMDQRPPPALEPADPSPASLPS